MSDEVNLANKVANLEVSPKFSNYSRVVIHVDDTTAIDVGNNTGRTLEFDNPFGTQSMAEDILVKLSGFQYQPYEALGALLDPAAEIGDGASVRGTYGGIYTREREFGKIMKANFSAPSDKEIDHEYEYESPQTRSFTRQINDVKASLIITNRDIEAKVSSRSPEGQTSFSWLLNDQSHTWYANGQEVMRVSASGLMVKGNVQATSGKIGGFTIGSNAIYNNISAYGSSSPSSGVYIGTNGIQLGQSFRVDPTGNVYASNMQLMGNITFLNSDGSFAGTMSAANLRYGASSAYSWSTSGMASNWTAGYNYGSAYNDATSQSSGSYPSFFRANTIWANYLYDQNGIKHPVGWRYMQAANGSYYYFLCGN